MWVDRQGRRKVPYKSPEGGLATPASHLPPVPKSTYVLDESDEEVQRTPLYSPPKKHGEALGARCVASSLNHSLFLPLS